MTEYNMKERVVYCNICKLEMVTAKLNPQCPKCNLSMFTRVFFNKEENKIES